MKQVVASVLFDIGFVLIPLLVAMAAGRRAVLSQSGRFWVYFAFALGALTMAGVGAMMQVGGADPGFPLVLALVLCVSAWLVLRFVIDRQQSRRQRYNTPTAAEAPELGRFMTRHRGARATQPKAGDDDAQGLVFISRRLR